MTGPTLDSFEQSLLADLRSHVVTRPQVARQGRRPRRRVLVSWAATAATAAIGAAVLVIGGPGSTPAFAVERHTDGDVVVTVMDWSDAAGLEQALEDDGVTAEVRYDTDAQHPTDLAGGGSSADCPVVGRVRVDPADDGGITFTLDARFVATHRADVLHVDAAGGRFAGDWAAVSVQWEGTGC